MLHTLDATNGDLLLINIISTRFGHLYAHRQESRLPVRQHSPHSEHSSPPKSPASQQLQQDRQP